MDRQRDAGNGYECVDPPVGRNIWQLDDPALDPAIRRQLAAHLVICDACRLQRDVERRVGRGLTTGRLTLRRRSAAGHEHRRATRRLVGGGGLLLAASLAALLLVPPRSRDAGRIERGAVAGAFRRPVEGEVVLSGRPRLTWRPVPGATAYRVRVSEVGGPFHWQGRTEAPELRLPRDVALPPHRDFRAVVTPVPPDLGPVGGTSVSFRRGSPGEWWRYRWRAAPPWIPVLAALGLALLAAALAAALRGSRLLL